MMERLRTRVVAAAVMLLVVGPANAAEPSRGRPYAASPLECLRLDSLPRHVGARDRRIVDALARRGTGGEGARCAVTRLTRFGGYPPAATWNVRLHCAGDGATQETWTQNGDGSVTVDRHGDKTTVRACERSAR
jgi:hypothetical protein